jgi:hypothetical protein
MNYLNLASFFLISFVGIILRNYVNSTQTQYPCIVLDECDVIKALVENRNSTIAQNILQGLGSKLKDLLIFMLN